MAISISSSGDKGPKIGSAKTPSQIREQLHIEGDELNELRVRNSGVTLDASVKSEPSLSAALNPKEEDKMKGVFGVLRGIRRQPHYVRFLHYAQEIANACPNASAQMLTDFTQNLLDIVSTVPSSAQDSAINNLFIYTKRYGLSHQESGKLSALLAKRSVSKSAPLVLYPDILFRGDNSEYGFGDIVFTSALSEYSERNITRLLAIAETVQLGDYRSFGRRRIEATALYDGSNNRISFIVQTVHRQHPNLKEFLQAIVDFYDKGRQEPLMIALPKVGISLNSRAARCLLTKDPHDLNFFYGHRFTVGYPEGAQTISGIEIIRRMNQATNLIQPMPSATVLVQREYYT